MTPWLPILRAFLNHDIYTKYQSSLDYRILKEYHPEISRLFLSLPALHKQGKPGVCFSIDDLQIAFATDYPNAKDNEFAPIFRQLQEIQFSPEQLNNYLDRAKDTSDSLKLVEAALKGTEGKSTREEIIQACEEFTRGRTIQNQESTDFASDDIEEILKTHYEKPGLRWRLKSLNTSLGSLRKGDFGFVFARPKTGKTTFLASEITYMAGQVDTPILWFNNEQEHGKVITRLHQSACGIDLPTLMSQVGHYKKVYQELTKGNIKLISETPTTKSLVERFISRYTPSLIIFDQIDKIQGFQGDRDDLELTAIYSWARELAKHYAPTIGVCQAGSTAEGKPWLGFNDVMNSKTGKQSECDWTLGIGKRPDEGLESYRYFHLPANHMQGDEDTIPSRRHDKWECKILPEIARYEDIAQ